MSPPRPNAPRQRPWIAIALLFLCGLSSQMAHAQGSARAPEEAPLPTLNLDIRPAEITVGEPVQVELSLVFAPGSEEIEPRMPAWQETWGKAEILQLGEVDSFRDSSGRRVVRQMLLLTAFETGSVRLPPLTLSLPYAAATVEMETPEGQGFEVTSVLPEDEEKVEPMAAAAPIQPPSSQRFLWTTGILVLLNSLAALYLLRRLGRVAKGEGLELLDPLEELLRRLGQVDPMAGAEPVHTRLSMALRRYLGRSLGFAAVESTTSEIHRRLRDASLPLALGQRTMRLLRLFDQVKFARGEVDANTTDERVVGTESLAREIESTLQPAVDEAAEEAANDALGARA